MELQGLVPALGLGTALGPGQSVAEEEEVGWQAEAAREGEQPADSARLVIDSLQLLSRVFKTFLDVIEMEKRPVPKMIR